MFAPRPLVFISYSRKDKVRVDKLRRRLMWHGVRTWLDTENIAAGDWRREIKIGLRNSNFFVACLSQNTAERGEVLQFEYDSALAVQNERLEGEVYIIPLRLEPCEIPDCLSHLNCIDLYDKGGWKTLIRVLRSKSRPWPVLAAALVLILAALGGYIWFRPTAQSELLDARSEGKAAVARGAVQLGLTLWKMEPSENSDPPSIREIVHPHASGENGTETKDFTPVRLPLDATFRLGDYFQVGIESSRIGYLYVVNRPIRADGTTGPATLIFPTNRILGGDNQIWPSKLIRLPDRVSEPWQFWSTRPDYAGELLIILLAPHPIAGIASQQEAARLPDDTVADWSRQWGSGVSLKSYGTSQPRLTVEEAAARDQGAPLTRAAPAPQFIFDANRGPEAPILCPLKIPVRTKQ